MYINKNDNTKIEYAQEVTVNGVTYPKQIFEDIAKLNELNIFEATIGEKSDPIFYTYEEVIDWDNNTISYTATPRSKEEIRSLTVPSSITKVQGMKAMKQYGIWETFKQAIESNEDAYDEWQLALDLERDNVFVEMLSPVLGVTSEQIDDMFILGASL